MERDPPHPPPAQHPALGLGLGRRDMASSPRPYPAMGQRGLGRGRKSVPGPCPSPMMRRDRKIVMDPSRMLAAKSVNLEMILLLFETPSGFALFSISGTMFRDPDAMENLWANFAEDRKAEIVTILKGFQTFDDKSTAFDPFTGVHEKLKNMIMNCRRPGQPLAVGKLEYKAIIQVTLGIPCLYCEKVMEVMWGLQNCMRSLVPQEESELSKEDRLPMSHGLIKFLNLNGFDDVQPEMINNRIIMTASVLFDCDSMLKEYYVPLSLFGNLIKRVSRIDTRDWDSLKLATALKVVFCPEVGDYNEMFSEDERSKLVNHAHVYVRDISESLASETYEKLLKTCEVRHKKSILLRNLVMEAKERMKGEDR